ncbi:MAG TPA: hypothetical protein VGC97_07385 [Pyrinomonadaceae bacterium]|jgi:hypothetical protein
MAQRKQPEGKCYFCGEILTRRKLFNHLEKCAQRRSTIEAAETSRRDTEKLFHLRAKFPYGTEFWLDLEVNGSATLKDLDYYFREIWLECCGHLSEFSAGDFFAGEISMKKKIADVFAREPALFHSYDFGSTTETMVEKIAVREGKPLTKHPIFLMSRNILEEAKCFECDKAAEYFCAACLYENEGDGMLCETHAEDHPHADDYGDPSPLVNSPRVGVCGYEGPAEPPY